MNTTYLGKEDWLTECGVIQPWQADPYRLFSWLEMLQFSANMFVYCGIALRQIESDALLNSMIAPGDEPAFAMFTELDDQAVTKATKWLKFMHDEFHNVGATITADTIADVIEDLGKTNGRRRNCQWLIDQVKHVERLSRKELREKIFFYVPSERAKFFPTKKEPHAFGDSVANAFPSARFDVNEGAICMALARSTAAVMHLMRALEPALVAMAKEVGFPPKRDNWGDLIDEIEARLKPGHAHYVNDRAKREFLAPAATQFRHFKDAWRNHAMHAREKYTPEEAEMVHLAVKSFMVHLAKGGLKE